MKILISTFTYPPNVDGVAAAASQMARIFKNAGHDVLVATSVIDRNQLPKIEDALEVKHFRITGSPALFDGFHGEVAAYQKFVIDSSPDVIICHCWNTWCSELLYPLLSRLRSRIILVSHGYSAHMLNMSILPKGLFKWMRWLPVVCSLPFSLRRFECVVFLSTKTDLKRYFDRWVAGVTGCRNTRVIPNGIDTSGWHSITTNFRTIHHLQGGVLFLCVANYFPGKNQMMALDAFIGAEIPGSKLVFIGSSLGDYGHRVAKAWDEKRQHYPMLEVCFLERLPRKEVVSAIMTCDVAILSSKTEAQPLTILEAMACGKPFISTDVGCVSELRGGIIVRDVSDMAATMKRLAEDANERFSLGTDAKKDFEAHYSAEVTSKAWLDLVHFLAPSST